jgi:predicted peptidase
MTPRILYHLPFFVLLLTMVTSIDAADFTDLYESHVFKSADGQTLPYRLMKPANYQADASVKYPLVLFLHGAGERGTDNVKTLVHGMREFAKDEVRAAHPCFVLVPQCPDGKRGVEVEWTLESHEQLPEDSAAIKLVLELMASVQKEYRIDEKRLYATGLSMGGFGVWDLVTRYPDKFAAAAPVCAGGDEKVASKSAKLPIWTFHGDKDTVVKPSRSRNMVAVIEKAGGKPIYTEYPEVGHNSWDKAYAEPKLMDWLFAQRRP